MAILHSFSILEVLIIGRPVNPCQEVQDFILPKPHLAATRTPTSTVTAQPIFVHPPSHSVRMEVEPTCDFLHAQQRDGVGVEPPFASVKMCHLPADLFMNECASLLCMILLTMSSHLARQNGQFSDPVRQANHMRRTETL